MAGDLARLTFKKLYFPNLSTSQFLCRPISTPQVSGETLRLLCGLRNRLAEAIRDRRPRGRRPGVLGRRNGRRGCRGALHRRLRDWRRRYLGCLFKKLTTRLEGGYFSGYLLATTHLAFSPWFFFSRLAVRRTKNQGILLRG